MLWIIAACRSSSLESIQNRGSDSTLIPGSTVKVRFSPERRTKLPSPTVLPTITPNLPEGATTVTSAPAAPAAAGSSTPMLANRAGSEVFSSTILASRSDCRSLRSLGMSAG